jgi:autotransporter-associated beta strand protein
MKRGRFSHVLTSDRNLKFRRINRLALHALSAAAACASTQQVLAQITPTALWWDINGVTSGAGGATVNGTWSATQTNWNTDSTGFGSGTVEGWVTDGAASFSAGTSSTGASTVTVVGANTFNSINVEEGTYTFTAGAGGQLIYDDINNTTTVWNIANTATFLVPIGTAQAAGTDTNTISFAGNGNIFLNANNTFDNNISINGVRTVTIANAHALGTNVGSTLITGSCTLAIQGTITVAEPISMTISGSSTITNAANNNTLSGPLTWNHGNSKQFVSTASGTTLSITGPINDGDSSGSSTGNLIKIGTGTLNLNSTSSFSGAVLAGLGTVTTGANAHFASNTSILVGGGVEQGATSTNGLTALQLGTFTLDKSTSGTSTVLDPGGTVQMNGAGVFNIKGGTVATNETVGNFVLTGGVDSQFLGENAVVAIGGTALTTITANNFQRNPGSLVVFQGNNLGGTGNSGVQIKLGNAASVLQGAGGSGSTVSILPGALFDSNVGFSSVGGPLSAMTGYGTDFVTSDANGLRSLAPGEYSATITGTNQNLSPTTVLATGDTTINSLRLNSPSSGLSIGATNTATLTSGMILSTANSSGNAGITGGTINTNGNEAIIVSNVATTISSNITNANGLTKQGFGTLTLSGTGSDYGGTTYVQQGALVAKTTASLGNSSKVTIAQGAALELDSGTGNSLTLAAPVTIGGSFTPIQRGIYGTYALGTTPYSSQTINALDDNERALSGEIGNLSNLSGNNTINGNVTLAGGANLLDGTPGSNVGNTGLNSIYVRKGSHLTINGSITGPNLLFMGGGTLSLASSNSIPSLFRVEGGILDLQANGAIGGNSLGVLINLAGSSGGAQPSTAGQVTVGFSNNVDYENAGDVLNNMFGYGVGTLGAIDNFGGNNTYVGPITYQQNIASFAVFQPNYIGSQAGTLKLTSNLKGGSNTLREFVKVGPGTLEETGNITFVGRFELTNGALVMNSDQGVSQFIPGAANAAVKNQIDAYAGTTLVFDNSGAGGFVNNRTTTGGVGSGTLAGVVGTATYLHNAEFKLIGAADGAQHTQSVPATGAGSFVFNGTPTLTVVQASPQPGNQTVMALGHTRTAGGFTLFMRANSLGTPDSVNNTDNEITDTTVPTLVTSGSGTGAETGIVPWVFGATSDSSNGTDLMTYGTAGFVPLTSAQYDSTFGGSLPGSDTNENFKINANQVMTASSGVNSMVVTTANSIDLGANNLTIKSGAMLAADTGSPTTTTISNGVLSFGGATGGSEAIIHTASNHNLAISATISGNGGLTKSGAGALDLTGGNNNFTGPVTIDGGKLIVDSDANLGVSTNPITLASVLQPTANYTKIPAARPITVVGLANAFNVPGGQTLEVDSQISGDQYSTLRKTGDGTLFLNPSGSNSYLGGTTVLGGVLKVGSDPALGSNCNVPGQNNTSQNPGNAAPMTLDGGTVEFSANTALGQRAIFFGKNSGTIAVDSGVTVTYDTASGLDAGLIPFTGPGTFFKDGPGTLEFANNSFVSVSYAGGTEIRNGYIKLDKTGTGAGNTGILPANAANTTVHVTSGTLVLSDSVTDSTGELILDGGTLAALGNSTLQIGTTAVVGFPQIPDGQQGNFVTLNSGATLNVFNAISNTDPTNVAALPTANIRGAGVVNLGAVAMSTFQGNFNVDGSTLRLGANSAAVLGLTTNQLQFSANGGTVDMRITGSGFNYNNPVVMNGDGTFLQSNTANGAAGKTNGFGALTVNTAATLTATNVNGATNEVNTGNPGVTFSKATLGGNLAVNVLNPAAGGGIGTVGIGTAAGLGLSETGGSRTLTKNGPGNLSILGSSNYSGGTTVNAGTLTAADSSALGVGSTNIVGGAVVLASGLTTAVRQTNLAIATGATLDVTNDKMIVDYTGTSPIAGLRTAARTAYLANWAAPGLTSSTAAADATHHTGVGVTEASDIGVTSFGGVSGIDTTAILMRDTYLGDANLDGQVNTSDFMILSLHFGQTTNSWGLADFNYDGVVNALDFNAIATNFGSVTLPDAPLLGSPLDGSPAVLGSLVPEPTSLSLLAMGVATLAGRRRRR